MIIKAKLLPRPIFMASFRLLRWCMRKLFNKLVIHDVKLQNQSSYLLMCNHTGFWDGFWAFYLCYCAIYPKQKINGLYFMSLKKQLQKNPWMKYFGSFSIVPHSRTYVESLSYAAEILSKPGNILLMYPQGNLESQYVRHIAIKDGICTLLPMVKGKCQLLWSSNLTEYFESLKPSIYFHMLDCGSHEDFNFEEFKTQVNQHHLQAIKKQFRYTEEPE
ncbi:lysophospholipid acyltransferase family protein [Pedobacter glucosidilyticus]|uniref:lysophospholipid acyltransferase family protein n=1 Tax=Pedobacter glucosidilyticus TaxID=1122941 RepID=UPI0026E9D913|nr:1-acyl-sn-glycerol-3-phosphate acyltransferase [Pedobacter glucosidilyticus]